MHYASAMLINELNSKTQLITIITELSLMLAQCFDNYEDFCFTTVVGKNNANTCCS